MCEGFGKVMGIDEDLVIPDKSMSVHEGCVACWRGEKMGEWRKEFVDKAWKYDFPIHRAYYDLSDAEKELLWKGNNELYGIDSFFKMLEENLYKIQYRVMLSRYRGKTTCPQCKGARLKKEALYVQVGGKTIADLVMMPIYTLKDFFDTLALDEVDMGIAKRLLVEIKNRIDFLMNVGLSYLTLNRLSKLLRLWGVAW